MAAFAQQKVLTGDQTKPDRRVTVLVTGFGAFREGYESNPSFEIARSLPGTLPGTLPGRPAVKIISHAQAIRVSYQTVLETVPGLLQQLVSGGAGGGGAGGGAGGGWGEVIVLHIGMASSEWRYTMETQAHRDGYTLPDVDGRTFSMPDGHDGGGVWKDMPALLQTGFDADQVLARWKLDAAVKNRNAVVERSDDAARFLCEFVYYTSLAWFRTRSGRPASSTSRLPVVFLHVPEDLVKAGKIQEGRDVTLALIRALADSYSL